jgi:hypothetical protein
VPIAGTRYPGGVGQPASHITPAAPNGNPGAVSGDHTSASLHYIPCDGRTQRPVTRLSFVQEEASTPHSTVTTASMQLLSQHQTQEAQQSSNGMGAGFMTNSADHNPQGVSDQALLLNGAGSAAAAAVGHVDMGSAGGPAARWSNTSERGREVTPGAGRPASCLALRNTLGASGLPEDVEAMCQALGYLVDKPRGQVRLYVEVQPAQQPLHTSSCYTVQQPAPDPKASSQPAHWLWLLCGTSLCIFEAHHGKKGPVHMLMPSKDTVQEHRASTAWSFTGPAGPAALVMLQQQVVSCTHVHHRGTLGAGGPRTLPA